jgi:hypothetical protein
MKYLHKVPFIFNRQPKNPLDVTTDPTRTNTKANLLGKLKLIAHPIYEIEYQENQWIQLKHSTSKYIEELYQRGFTRMVIRRDKQLNEIIPERAILIISISQKNSNEYISEKDKVFNIRRKKLLEFKNNSNEKWILLNGQDTPTISLKNDSLSYTEPPFVLEDD